MLLAQRPGLNTYAVREVLWLKITENVAYVTSTALHDPMSLSHPICRWAEDGSLVEEDGGSFTNWYPGDPSLGTYGNCMFMYQEYDATWTDTFNCDNARSHSVCSKPIGSSAARNISRA